MFGKLTLEQRKALQAILIDSGVIAIYQQRVNFLESAGIGRLTKSLPMQEDENIFAGALVRECERLGTPPDLGEYATVLLAKEVRNALIGQTDVVKTLTDIMAVYVTDPELKYPLPVQKSRPSTGKLVNNTEKILFLSPNPMKLTQLDVQQEMREIEDELRIGQHDGSFVFEIGVAVRTRDLTSLLLKYKPTILHFAGHGVADEGLWFRNEDEEPVLVNPQVLAVAFSHPTIKRELKCIVLNACWSDSQAVALVERARIPAVVGMTNAISDKGAIAFAGGFYRGLSDGMTIEDAFYFGRNEMVLRLNDLDYEALAKIRMIES